MQRLHTGMMILGGLALCASASATEWGEFDIPNGSYGQIYTTTVPANGKIVCKVEIDKSLIKQPWVPAFMISARDENDKAFTLFSSTEEIGKRLFGVKVSQGENVEYQSSFLGMVGDQNKFSLELYWWDTRSAAFRANVEKQQFGQGMMQNIGFVVSQIKVSASGIKGRAACGPEITD